MSHIYPPSKTFNSWKIIKSVAVVVAVALGIRNDIGGIAQRLKNESIAQYFLQNKNSKTPS